MWGSVGQISLPRIDAKKNGSGNDLILKGTRRSDPPMQRRCSDLSKDHDHLGFRMNPASKNMDMKKSGDQLPSATRWEMEEWSQVQLK